MHPDQTPDFVPLDPYTHEPWNPTLAAAEGAALLDRLPWPGWREQVDPARLDMAYGGFAGRPDCMGCVGAQLDLHHLLTVLGVPADEAHGEYTSFLAEALPVLLSPFAHYWTGVDFTIHYGFRVPLIGAAGELYERLTDAWRAVLTDA